MYDNIFLSSQGSDLFVNLGALDAMKEKLSGIERYNVCGNSSLIVFFKCLGYTFRQIYELLKRYDFLIGMINGFSLLPENEENKHKYIRSWLEDILESRELFKKNVTLKEIKRLTNITPCFLVWSRTDKKIVNISHENNPDLSLIDCMMVSLCGIGLYNTYEINSSIYSNMFAIDSFPLLYSIVPDPEKLFVIMNLTNFNPKYNSNGLGPLEGQENELIVQGLENKIHRINILDEKIINKCKLYSYYLRGNVSLEEKEGIFKTGFKQGKAFMEGRDTKEVDEFLRKAINLQT